MISREQLRHRLSYDPDSGQFVWRNPHKLSHFKAGSIAGARRKDGYTKIAVDGKQYLAHRLAWLYMTGGWPVFEIDHIDGDRTNTRWSNLRQANSAQNKGNAKLRKDNTTGYKGVTVVQGKYVAQIGRGAGSTLGYYDTAEEAHSVYLAAAKERWGAYARSG